MIDTVSPNDPKQADDETMQLDSEKSQGLLETDKDTLALIRQLQEEEEKELIDLRQALESKEMDTFTCKICFEQFEDEGEIFPLNLCEHVFHRECLQHYLESQIEISKFPMNCPDTECKQEVADLDLRDLLNEKLYAKFSSFAFNQAVDMQKDISWCPTADCKFAFISEEKKEEGKANELKCP